MRFVVAVLLSIVILETSVPGAEGKFVAGFGIGGTFSIKASGRVTGIGYDRPKSSGLALQLMPVGYDLSKTDMLGLEFNLTLFEFEDHSYEWWSQDSSIHRTVNEPTRTAAQMFLGPSWYHDFRFNSYPPEKPYSIFTVVGIGAYKEDRRQFPLLYGITSMGYLLGVGVSAQRSVRFGVYYASSIGHKASHSSLLVSLHVH